MVYHAKRKKKRQLLALYGHVWCQELWIAAEALLHSKTLERILGLALFIGNYLPLGIPLSVAWEATNDDMEGT